MYTEQGRVPSSLVFDTPSSLSPSPTSRAVLVKRTSASPSSSATSSSSPQGWTASSQKGRAPLTVPAALLGRLMMRNRGGSSSNDNNNNAGDDMDGLPPLSSSYLSLPSTRGTVVEDMGADSDGASGSVGTNINDSSNTQHSERSSVSNPYVDGDKFEKMREKFLQRHLVTWDRIPARYAVLANDMNNNSNNNNNNQSTATDVNASDSFLTDFPYPIR